MSPDRDRVVLGRDTAPQLFAYVSNYLSEKGRVFLQGAKKALFPRWDECVAAFWGRKLHRTELLLQFLAAVCFLVLRLGAQSGQYTEAADCDPVPGTRCLSKALVEPNQTPVN